MIGLNKTWHIKQKIWRQLLTTQSRREKMVCIIWIWKKTGIRSGGPTRRERVHNYSSEFFTVSFFFSVSWRTYEGRSTGAGDCRADIWSFLCHTVTERNTTLEWAADIRLNTWSFWTFEGWISFVHLASTGWVSPTTKMFNMLTSGSLRKMLGLAWCWKCRWFHQLAEAPWENHSFLISV